MLSSAAIALVAGASAALAVPSVSISVAGAKAVKDVDNFNVHTKITNTGSETLRLLNDPNSLLTPTWHTPTFEVQSADGVRPDFKGLYVKYVPKVAAKDKAYKTLAPGESVQVTHPLGGVYNFTEAGRSVYTVKPSSLGKKFYHVKADGSTERIEAQVVNDIQTQLTGNTTPKAYVGLSSRRRRDNQFSGCDDGQVSDLTTAASDAQGYADESSSYASGLSGGTDRYTTWFGAFSSENLGTITDHYNHIKDGQLSTDTFDCSACGNDPGTYAYVYPDQFGTIYLCGAFWTAPPTGTDSKAGTLVHESSHFTNNGGTSDYVYGQDGAKQLAQSNPEQAIFNADSHEYFAENNPSQS